MGRTKDQVRDRAIDQSRPCEGGAWRVVVWARKAFFMLKTGFYDGQRYAFFGDRLPILVGNVNYGTFVTKVSERRFALS